MIKLSSFLHLLTLTIICNSPSPALSVDPPPPTTTTNRRNSDLFTFPESQSTVLPDPSSFFSSNLLSSPLPTNSFFQNFVIENGNQSEYIHPYLIKSDHSSLSLSYPSLFSNSTFIQQIFTPDITVSVLNQNPNRTHVVSSFSDLSVTLDLQPGLRFFLVRGSPYVTCQILQSVPVLISTVHKIRSFVPDTSKTRFKINLSNGQTWILYSSSAINLTPNMTRNVSTISSEKFIGVIRIALLPNQDSELESVLDKFSSCYPVSGNALFPEQFTVQYKWEKKGFGDLLMLANPLHLRLLHSSPNSSDSSNPSNQIIKNFKYKSVDGELIGVVGTSWVLKSDPVSVTWDSIKGVQREAYKEIIDALKQDVKGLDSSNMSTNSSYFYGKLVARAARLALIAEEVDYLDVIPKVKNYLKDTIEPWLDGTFAANAYLYDKSWGGLITKQGSTDRVADFGFGIYNDHHFHIGYFLYGIAVLANIDPDWGRKYRPQAYSLMSDFMTLSNGNSNSNNNNNGLDGPDSLSDSKYTRLRCFDLWKLHSWAAGLTEFENGRNQESTSEAINAYYSVALIGLAYNDSQLTDIGSLLTAMEIQSAQTWWHVKEDDTLYPADFAQANRVVGILWANKRDSILWFASAEFREFRLGIQVLPLLPITEVLFSDKEYTKELVEWTLPSLEREGVGEGWKGFVYALEGVYDTENAVEKVRSLRGHDDGNSKSNMLWWIFSRSSDGHYVAASGGCAASMCFTTLLSIFMLYVVEVLLL